MSWGCPTGSSTAHGSCRHSTRDHEPPASGSLSSFTLSVSPCSLLCEVLAGHHGALSRGFVHGATAPGEGRRGCGRAEGAMSVMLGSAPQPCTRCTYMCPAPSVPLTVSYYDAWTSGAFLTLEGPPLPSVAATWRVRGAPVSAPFMCKLANTPLSDCHTQGHCPLALTTRDSRTPQSPLE